MRKSVLEVIEEQRTVLLLLEDALRYEARAASRKIDKAYEQRNASYKVARSFSTGINRLFYAVFNAIKKGIDALEESAYSSAATRYKKVYNNNEAKRAFLVTEQTLLNKHLHGK